ncbi:MAG: LysM peptidoglycan-binding domain-containing protein [Opitutaceae bacterium]|jgi:LysM repeat protein|nr:LysM peptidoglycan-binding domain-containing protein [Opitutaceae bacterium]
MLASVAFVPWLLVFAAVVMAFLALAARASAKNGGSPAPPPAASAPLPAARDISGFSREKLREMLRRIENEPAPEQKMGAMCYAMAVPPDRAEYVCPSCGQKTLYAGTKNNRSPTVHLISRELTAMRRLASEIQKHTNAVTLLEDEFCSHCRGPVLVPGVSDSPTARLRVRLDEKTETITRGVTENDLRLLLGFFSGALDWKAFNDGTLPLKASLPRLRRLLGENPGVETKLAADGRRTAPGGGEEKSAGLDYMVAAGDTGLAIARKFDMPFADLRKLNPGVRWERLKIGQKLTIHAPGNE